MKRRSYIIDCIKKQAAKMFGAELKTWEENYKPMSRKVWKAYKRRKKALREEDKRRWEEYGRAHDPLWNLKDPHETP